MKYIVYELPAKIDPTAGFGCYGTPSSKDEIIRLLNAAETYDHQMSTGFMFSLV